MGGTLVMLRLLLLLTIVSVFTVDLVAQESPSWERVQHLQHGINASEWFAQSGDYSVQRLRSYITVDDIDLMKRMGFDHVRISIDPAVFQCTGPWNQCERVQALDEVIAHSLAHDLAVVLDLHPSGEYKRQIATSDAAVEQCALLWSRIAGHFAKLDPERVFFEVMNEPELSDAFRWSGVEQRLASAIRRQAPSHTIIVAGTQYSDIEDLIRLPEFRDRNLIFNFHYYEPHIFTHQGASWGAPYWIGLSAIPFPASAAQVDDAKTKQIDDYARWKLTQYGLEHWDENRIATEIAFAADWAKSRKVPLTCNEFGAYRNFMNPEDRLRWIVAVRNALEQNKVGWTMWDYRGGFGVIKKENDKSVQDAKVLHALGLGKN
jgi:aryl-phospho-beta-D-glucosidase BglC (GH1 family)